MVAAVFFVSILPPFWTIAIANTNIRYLLWLLTFFVRRGGNLYTRRIQRQGLTLRDAAQPAELK